MSVVISDALARDLLWWVQNNPVPYVTVGEHYERWGRNQKPMMEIARDSMVEELKGAIDKPKVWLTVEEAKTLIDFFVTMKPEMPNGGCMEYCDLWRDFLQKRIEQAEKKK